MAPQSSMRPWSAHNCFYEEEGRMETYATNSLYIYLKILYKSSNVWKMVLIHLCIDLFHATLDIKET